MMDDCVERVINEFQVKISKNDIDITPAGIFLEKGISKGWVKRN